MQLTTSSLIKLIIGIIVFVAVIVGFYLAFKTKLIDLFSGLPKVGESFLLFLQ